MVAVLQQQLHGAPVGVPVTEPGHAVAMPLRIVGRVTGSMRSLHSRCCCTLIRRQVLAHP
jgi:hypothetical protein